MRPTVPGLALLPLAALLPLSACAPLPMPDVPEESSGFHLDLAGKDVVALTIRCHNASILVDESDAVAVDGECRARGRSDSEATERTKAMVPRLEIVDRVAVVSGVNPIFCPLSSCDYTLRVRITRAMPLSIEIGDGHVTARGDFADLRVTTRSGSIAAQLTGGTADLRSESGEIRVAGTARELTLHNGVGLTRAMLKAGVPVPDHVAFFSRSGSLQVEVPASLKVVLEHTTQSGRFESDLPVEWTADLPRVNGFRVKEGTLGFGPLSTRLGVMTTSGLLSVTTGGAAVPAAPAGSGAGSR